MDRNREVRRGSMAAANGLSRRRHRNSSLRDSPEEDGQMELQDSARLRDRGNKKDRDRDRDRSSRNKRRRGDRLMHGSNREEGGEDSTEESIDEEEEDEDEDSGALRMLTPNPPSSSLSNHHHQRKSFPPGKFVRAAPTWKGADEMIGVSVPRKARSASAKRSHECWMSGSLASGGGAEQIHRQASTSPARLNATAPSPAPISPSSSNVSVRKKMKPIGHKQRPPKMAKPSSSSQEDIEIEVAEVLYGLMRQSQCPPKQEILSNASQKFDSKDTNGSSNEVRSRVSSPVSISPPAAAHQPSVLPQNSCTSTTTLPVVAPKRKRPRPVKPEEESPTSVAGRNGSISAAAAKVENEQPAKSEASSPKSEMNSGSAGQNAGASVDLASQPAGAISSLEPPQLEPVKAESNTASDPKPFTEESETREGVQTREEVPSSKKESPPCTKLDGDLEDATATKTVSTVSEVEYKREEKFKIDLMAPPLKSSPERDGDMEYISDPKSMALDVEMVPKAETLVTAEEMTEEIAKQDAVEGRFEEKNKEQLVEESESEKPLANTERILDLQLDLEKPDKDSGTVSVSGSKQQPQLSQVQKQQQQQLKATTRNDPKIEKAAQSTSLPLPMTLAGWPGGLPSLGYMPPLQAVVSMDGSTGSSTAVQPPHFPLSQPRPKRCATHYYIARNIFYHQQFTRINPFWPAPAGSASMYGAKPYNLNVVPPTEGTILGNPLQGNFAGRSLNSVQEKVQASGTISGHNTKDKSSVPVAANFMDATQRKQLVLQQAPQPAGAGNLLHGPAFIFPMSQQQQQQQAAAAAAAASRSGAVKSGVATGNAALPSGANSGPVAPAGSSSTAAGTATTVSFNYPNLPVNEAQYLAILPNNGFPIPIPAHVGTAPPYRGGSPAQAMSFFNGFYSSQMIHPSQLQQQAQQQQAHSHPQPVQQGHQNTSTSSGSSSSQKHQQAQQQQRLQGGGSNAGGGNSKNFPASKNRLPMQQQQNHAVPASNQARQHEVEVGGEDSPSTADSRGSHARKSIYGQNFAVPVHPQNYTLMSPAALGSGGSGNHNEKQQSGKGGVELFPSQPFAVSFASFNGAATAAPGLNFSSLAQNHAIFQTLPDAARQGYQIAAAAAATQVAQQKKNQHISEEGKTGGDSINVEDERRGTAGKALAGVGQSLAFSRPDSSDPSVSTVLGNVIDGSARSLSLISAPINGNRAARPTSSTSTTPTSAPASSPSTQQQQQQQLIQLQKQQQMQQQQHQQQQMQQQLAAVVARSKTTSSSNVNVYSDRNLSTSSMATKFPSSLSVFPQALIQSSSPVQSPQWKNSSRTMGSQVPSPSLASTSTSSLKNLPQQQSRTQQGSQTHISFGVNPKAATAPQGQQIPMCHNQSPSPPVVMGSPPSSSISSKGAGGSPRTSSTGGGKAGSSPALPSQQPKNSPSGPSRKSSPVGGRNVPSILSNSHMGPALSSGGKSQSQSQVQVQQQQQQQQQQQHQLQKQTLQQPQIFFTNTYMQGPSPQSTNTTNTISSNSATTGYYHQRRQSDPHQGASTTSSGMLSLCPPLTLAGASTSDPAKAVAAAAAAAAVAANSMKGGMPPGLLHAAQFAAQTAAANSHQLMSAAFPYLHTGPAISVKPAEQKQPAGNDNLHACWQPEKEMKR